MTQQGGYSIPVGRARIELRVVNSRFIGSAGYAPTVESAKDFIAHIRTEFPDATHHAYAYVIGHGSSVIAGMSDDGEPSGTAGRPMLAIVRGSGLGDVTVVATRYFGGTRLGTGGLVHAYGDTTRAVLDILPRTQRIAMQRLTIRIPYSSYTVVRQAIESYEGLFEHEDFAVEVTVTVNLPAHHAHACGAVLRSITGGQAEIFQSEYL